MEGTNVLEIRYHYCGGRKVYAVVYEEDDWRYRQVMNSPYIIVLSVVVIAKINDKGEYVRVTDATDHLTVSDYKELIDAALDGHDLVWAADLTKRMLRAIDMERRATHDNDDYD